MSKSVLTEKPGVCDDLGIALTVPPARCVATDEVAQHGVALAFRQTVLSVCELRAPFRD